MITYYEPSEKELKVIEKQLKKEIIKKRTSFFGIGIAQVILGVITFSLCVASTTLWLEQFKTATNESTTQYTLIGVVVLDYIQEIWSTILLIIAGSVAIVLSRDVTHKLAATNMALSMLAALLLSTLIAIQFCILIISSSIDTTTIILRTIALTTALAGFALCIASTAHSCKVKIPESRPNRIGVAPLFGKTWKPQKLPLHETPTTHPKRIEYRPNHAYSDEDV